MLRIVSWPEINAAAMSIGSDAAGTGQTRISAVIMMPPKVAIGMIQSDWPVALR